MGKAVDAVPGRTDNRVFEKAATAMGGKALDLDDPAMVELIFRTSPPDSLLYQRAKANLTPITDSQERREERD